MTVHPRARTTIASRTPKVQIWKAGIDWWVWTDNIVDGPIPTWEAAVDEAHIVLRSKRSTPPPVALSTAA